RPEGRSRAVHGGPLVLRGRRPASRIPNSGSVDRPVLIENGATRNAARSAPQTSPSIAIALDPGSVSPRPLTSQPPVAPTQIAAHPNPAKLLNEADSTHPFAAQSANQPAASPPNHRNAFIHAAVTLSWNRLGS